MARRPLVYVVRHGETELNADDKFRGNKDVPLTYRGRGQAFRLAGFMHDKGISGVFHSDHKRAADTAKIITEALDEPAVRVGMAGLRSWNFGDFSGKEKTPARMREFQQYLDDPSLEIPGGESLNAFRARIGSRWRTAIRAAKQKGGPLLIVTSSSVIHEIGRLCNGDVDSCMVGPAGIIGVYAPDDARVIEKGDPGQATRQGS